MKFNHLKTLALTAIVTLSAGLTFQAHAQTETIGATLTTSGTLSTARISDFDFGEYFIFLAGGDTPTLTIDDNGAVAVAVAGDADPGTFVTQVSPPTTRGEMTVTVPAPGMALTLTRDSSNDFADAGLSMTAVEYGTATDGNSNDISTDLDTGTVTVVAANTPESILFGSEITVATVPGNATHTADFTVTLSF